MDRKNKLAIQKGETALGLELGSTRIKAVLIGPDHTPLASGDYTWENRQADGIWTYPLEEAWAGIQEAYRLLAREVWEQYGEALVTVGAMGVSAMMHGYLPFDREGRQLAAFRTWRNTITEKEAAELTDLFGFNIPQRWSAAHLYRAVRLQEAHVPSIGFLTTLAGYIHWQLTGRKVLGTGEAAGMFPLNSATKDYDSGMLDQFDSLTEPYGLPWKIRDILPAALTAGDDGGFLTPAGAKLLDPSGCLQPGVPFCPPEGDAGTGMAATNSVAVRTGNVSAGTSVFGMIVLEKELKKVHEEIDLVTTPDGHLVAMAHCNNCTSDLNAWVNVFKEFAESFGMEVDMNKLFGTLYNKALEGDKDCGGLLAYNYFSGEHIVGMEEGRPLFVRTANAKFNLANFMRVNLFASLGVLKTGLDILFKEEGVQVDEILGHGGLFKTKGVGQKILAAAINTPVSVMETAGEGGAWGIALLASYMIHREDGETLDTFLNRAVFAGEKGSRMEPDAADVAGFDAFIERYSKGLPIERAAIDFLK